MKLHKFDIKKYDFRNIIEDYLETNDLENIYDPYLKFANASDCLNTKNHKIYNYKIQTDDRFLTLYKKFIKEYISKLFNFDILFERMPLLRVHQKNNISTFDYHIDSTYLTPDGVYDIYKHEINFWMPLTKAYDTNSLWIESQKEKGDYSPIVLNYGEIFQFDGANLHHGTEINKTGQTRVSLDFRILPKKVMFENKEKISKETLSNLKIYYDEISNLTYN
jgi:hypothetical protein